MAWALSSMLISSTSTTNDRRHARNGVSGDKAGPEVGAYMHRAMLRATATTIVMAMSTPSAMMHHTRRPVCALDEPAALTAPSLPSAARAQSSVAMYATNAIVAPMASRTRTYLRSSVDARGVVMFVGPSAEFVLRDHWPVSDALMHISCREAITSISSTKRYTIEHEKSPGD